MVRKLLQFLYKETGTLNQAALLLGFFAVLSHLLALVRDRLLAHIFGASLELDIYYAAFRVPDFIFITVASVVSLSVLVPFIIEKDAEGALPLRKFINNIFSFFSLLIMVASVLAYFLMPTISELLFRDFSVSALDRVVFISRILLLSPIILGFSNLLGSLTQAYNRFTVYALAPLLYNAGIILGVVLLAAKIGVVGVAIGVVLGAFLHALIQVPFVVKSDLFPKFSWKLDFASIAGVVKISLPRTLTLALSSIGFIFLVAWASSMATGSVSVLSLSFNLQSVPISIIGISYSLAAFPTLSKWFREKNFEVFVKQMALTTRFIIFWSLPLTALFIVLRAQIVRVALGSGLFSWNDTRLTAAALALFAVSALFQSLSLLFIRGFYSAGFTKKPLFVNLVSTAVLILGTWFLLEIFSASSSFRFFLESLLRVEDIPGTSVLILPLGFSLAAIFNTLVLWFVFEKEFKGFSRGIMRTLFEGLGTSVLVGAAAYISLNILVFLFKTDSLWGIFLQGFLSGLLAVGLGIVVLIALKSRELKDIWTAVKSRFWKTRVIATDPEIV